MSTTLGRSPRSKIFFMGKRVPHLAAVADVLGCPDPTGDPAAAERLSRHDELGDDDVEVASRGQLNATEIE